MKKREGERGFIKKLVVIVVFMSIAFMVLVFLARYLMPVGSIGSLNTIGSGINPGTGYSPSVEVRTNPLLDFGLGGEFGSYSPSRPSSGGPDKGGSPYSQTVYLSTGNVYTAQPGDEYLVLRNTSGKAVDITGWTLTNGKGTRPIETSHNSYFYPAADSAVIGQGTEFLDPSGRFVLGNIILRNGDMAYITTGRPFSQFPFPISTSFRENICVGYLENYPFEPQLQENCPLATNDPQINTVTDECYDYMRSLPRCTDPSKFTTKYEKDRYNLLTSQCRNFMTVRLNYPSCVASNTGSANFVSKQWRIFLGKGTELWRQQRETITLYDKNGLIVDQISY